MSIRGAHPSECRHHLLWEGLHDLTRLQNWLKCPSCAQAGIHPSSATHTVMVDLWICFLHYLVCPCGRDWLVSYSSLCAQELIENWHMIDVQQLFAELVGGYMDEWINGSSTHDENPVNRGHSLGSCVSLLTHGMLVTVVWYGERRALNGIESQISGSSQTHEVE